MAAPQVLVGPSRLRIGESLTSLARSLAVILLSIALFGVFLALTGRNPVSAFALVYTGTLGSVTGLTEVGVLAIPFLLTGLAAAIPARVGLINVGGDGQMYLGAWAATGVALYAPIPGLAVLPAMLLAGCVGGGIWAGLAITLRQLRGVNEVISTLLLNYVGPLFVNVFVFGPWKSPTGNNYPYTENFRPSAILPAFGDTRLHLGVIVPLVAVAAFAIVLKRTKWGFNMRVVGGNPQAARRQGINVTKYLVVAMLIGGAIAGLAGMTEVAGIDHQLRPGISNGYGYTGFLASWMAGHDPVGLVGTSLLLALVTAGGGVLQFSADVPSAAMNILIGLMLFMVLGLRPLSRPAAQGAAT